MGDGVFLRGGNKARERFDRGQQPELADKLADERVVRHCLRGDGGQRLADFPAGFNQPGAAQVDEVAADALLELPGCFAGEGQPQHLVGFHHPVRDQIDHAAGHRFRLAGSGAGGD